MPEYYGFKNITVPFGVLFVKLSKFVIGSVTCAVPSVSEGAWLMVKVAVALVTELTLEFQHRSIVISFQHCFRAEERVSM